MKDSPTVRTAGGSLNYARMLLHEKLDGFLVLAITLGVHYYLGQNAGAGQPKLRPGGATYRSGEGTEPDDPPLHRPTNGLLRLWLSPHPPYGWSLGEAELLGHFESEPPVVRDVRRLGRFEVGADSL